MEVLPLWLKKLRRLRPRPKSVRNRPSGSCGGTAGAPEAALNEAQEALPAGILVAGDHAKVTGPGGTLNELHASQFYTRLGK